MSDQFPFIYVPGFTIDSTDGSLHQASNLGYDLSSPLYYTEEGIGSGPTLSSSGGGPFYVNLLGVDAFSTDQPRGYVDHPIYGDASSGTVYSYERWVRLRIVITDSTAVSNFRFWTFNGDATLPGWTYYWGTSSTYHQPVNTASSIAVNALPMSDPGTANCGGTTPLTGPGTFYSDWIVLQASADLSVVTDPGPALGYSSGTPISILLYLAVVQHMT